MVLLHEPGHFGYLPSEHFLSRPGGMREALRIRRPLLAGSWRVGQWVLVLADIYIYIYIYDPPLPPPAPRNPPGRPNGC